MTLRSIAAAPPKDFCDPSQRLFSAAAGETIFREGEPTFGNVRMVSGVARLVRYETDGLRNLLAFVLPGEVSESLPSSAHRFDLEASSDLQFTFMACDDPLLMNTPLDHIVGFEERLVERCHLLNYRPVMVRLAAFLAAIGARLEADNDGQFVIPIPQTDIAAYLATTPESVCRALRQLREFRIVDHLPSGDLAIIDQKRLGWILRERELAA